MTNLPTFDELRHQHAILAVNTGRQIQLLGSTGLITDDVEGGTLLATTIDSSLAGS